MAALSMTSARALAGAAGHAVLRILYDAAQHCCGCSAQPGALRTQQVCSALHLCCPHTLHVADQQAMAAAPVPLAWPSQYSTAVGLLSAGRLSFAWMPTATWWSC